MKKRRAFIREYKLEAFKKVILQGMAFCESFAKWLLWKLQSRGDVLEPIRNLGAIRRSLASSGRPTKWWQKRHNFNPCLCW